MSWVQVPYPAPINMFALKRWIVTFRLYYVHKLGPHEYQHDEMTVIANTYDDAKQIAHDSLILFDHGHLCYRSNPCDLKARRDYDIPISDSTLKELSKHLSRLPFDGGGTESIADQDDWVNRED